MKPYLKNIIIAAVSALITGTVVVGVFKMNPGLRSILESDKPVAKVTDGESVFEDILKQQSGIRRQFDGFFNDDFFNQNDPFKEMQKMRKEMEKQMQRLDGESHSMSNPFDSWFSDKFGGGTVYDISKREDENYVYYDINVDDLKSTSIDTKVENGYITITGSQENKVDQEDEEEGNRSSAESLFKSQFKRTFPLPENVDASKMETTSDGNMIVLKFPKLKA